MQKPIIIISGPTCTGKTSVAVELCKKINGEIISADSRQVYKYLDIGTNKEGNLESDSIRYIDGVAQHLTDIICPDEKYTAKRFEQDAEIAVKKILNKGKTAVITGGTGLYIKSFLYGLDDLPNADDKIRDKIKDDIKENGLDFVYKQLLAADPESANKNKKNPQRIMRALEIYRLTGKKMSRLLAKKQVKNIDFKHFVICKDREVLYRDINLRCDKMIDCGMIEETQKVLKMGFKKDSLALTGVGYKHIIQYLSNKISKQELIDKFSTDTRQYAKRQITWFKSQPETVFLNLPKKQLSDEIISQIY